eukprot:6195792-Pleurochrysis_carterae.AAC.2
MPSPCSQSKKEVSSCHAPGQRFNQAGVNQLGSCSRVEACRARKRSHNKSHSSCLSRLCASSTRIRCTQRRASPIPRSCWHPPHTSTQLYPVARPALSLARSLFPSHIHTLSLQAGVLCKPVFSASRCSPGLSGSLERHDGADDGEEEAEHEEGIVRADLRFEAVCVLALVGLGLERLAPVCDEHERWEDVDKGRAEDGAAERGDESEVLHEEREPVCREHEEHRRRDVQVASVGELSETGHREHALAEAGEVERVGEDDGGADAHAGEEGEGVLGRVVVEDETLGGRAEGQEAHRHDQAAEKRREPEGAPADQVEAADLQDEKGGGGRPRAGRLTHGGEFACATHTEARVHTRARRRAERRAVRVHLCSRTFEDTHERA